MAGIIDWPFLLIILIAAFVYAAYKEPITRIITRLNQQKQPK